MADMNTYLAVKGNLTGDPELRHTGDGVAVVNFTIASTPRIFDRASNEFKDGETAFVRCSAWREQAENIAATFTKGMRVFADGNLVQRNWETDGGEKRSVLELQVDECGPSLKYATAAVTRVTKGNQASAPAAQAAAPAAQAAPVAQAAPAMAPAAAVNEPAF